MRVLLVLTMVFALPMAAEAAVDSTTLHDTSATGLNGHIVVGDAISGLIATELPGDQGWHSANPASSDPTPLDNPDGLPAFTDDDGILSSNLTGLLNDFPPAGAPTKRVQYDLAGPTSIGAIQVLTGNNLGSDGRVFSTFTVSTSTDNGDSFSLLGYFESDPLGTINTSTVNGWRSTLVTVFDDASPYLATGVTNLQFDFYAVDNTGGQYRDPFDGVNPFTSIDDQLSAAFVSPLVWEIDVIAIPEPATAALLACALGFAFSVARRRK